LGKSGEKVWELMGDANHNPNKIKPNVKKIINVKKK
jgi:hypothetical protein